MEFNEYIVKRMDGLVHCKTYGWLDPLQNICMVWSIAKRMYGLLHCKTYGWFTPLKNVWMVCSIAKCMYVWSISPQLLRKQRTETLITHIQSTKKKKKTLLSPLNNQPPSPKTGCFQHIAYLFLLWKVPRLPGHFRPRSRSRSLRGAWGAG